jgi:DNA-directed RNA polymerase specialized sigma subunit
MTDDLDGNDLQEETMRVLMAGVRVAAERMQPRLPAEVHVNDVVSAGYLALTQALAYWQDAGDEVAFEAHAMKRASAAMLAVARGSVPPSREGRFVSEMARVQESMVDALAPELGSLDLRTIASPPPEPEHDVALEELGIHVA